MKFIKGEGFRFLLAGGANTLFTYLVYLLMLDVFGYILAFTISFSIGVIFAFVIYSLFVFRSPITFRKFFQYPILYILQYIMGLILLTIMVERLGLDKQIAPLVNVIALTPITFILNKWFLLYKGERL